MKKCKRLIGVMLAAVMTITAVPGRASAQDVLSKMTPIHSFTFDNDSGTTVNDSVAVSAVKGTATGTTLIAGYDGTGKARHFDGNSYIAFNDKVIPKGQKTISFKIRKYSMDSERVGEYIFSNVINAITNYGTYGYIDASGKLTIRICNATSNTLSSISSPESICDGKWHDILFTWDGTMNKNSVKLYIDEMNTPANVATSLFLEKDTSSAAYNLNFGRLPNDGGNKFIGDLDDFKVYNEVYTPEKPEIDYEGNHAILEITMTNNTIKEYSLTSNELESFLTWYDKRSDGIGKSYYRIPKKSNVKPFLSRKEYLYFDKIYSFEVKDYNE